MLYIGKKKTKLRHLMAQLLGNSMAGNVAVVMDDEESVFSGNRVQPFSTEKYHN